MKGSRDTGPSRHDTRSTEQIAHAAADFIVRESAGQSLITVTHARLAAHGDRASVFVSIFPIEQATTALQFLNNRAGEFRDYLHRQTRLHPLPRIEFMLDDGSSAWPLDVLKKKP